MTGGFQYETGLLGVLASADIAARSSAIVATPLFTVPAVPVGNPVGSIFYRVSWAFKIIQAATTSSSLGPFQVSFVSADDGVTVIEPNLQVGNYTNSTANSLVGGMIGGYLIINPAAGSVVSFIMNYSSTGATPMIYVGHVKIELA